MRKVQFAPRVFYGHKMLTFCAGRSRLGPFMKAAIYMRTWCHDKGHHAYSLQRQERDARSLAAKHGLTIADEHVFSDIDHPGDAPPACWVRDDDQACRPALAALIHAVEEGLIKRVIVRKMERLSSAADTLTGLQELFKRHQVLIIATPENVSFDSDPTEAFAISILAPCIRYDTDEDCERKVRLKAKKIEEIQRLQDKIHRMETEIAELQL